MQQTPNSVKDRGSAVSTNDLIIDNKTNTIQSETQVTKPKKKKRKTQVANVTTKQTTVQQPALSGVFGISRAATICWYILIGIIFLIAFVALVLSVLYFVSDTTTEQVVKLYGICGAGSLIFVTIGIVCLDCCNDGNRRAREEMARYSMLQAIEEKRRALAQRRAKRTVTEDKDEKPKPFIIQHQGTQAAPPEPEPHSHHMHHYPYHHYPAIGYLIPAPPIVIDTGMNTSEKFVPPSWSRNEEHGTQTDRTEGTQTSAMELNRIPNNVTEIIHERTILKAPKELIGTIKESMAQQDRNLALDSDAIDANTLIAFN
ncbi:unnamed protein product [Adineta ricciae]|uniref:Transmembrane protein n=1 Tax=Adineta ricciae TaxID=249248 RepID=A0A814UU65_ADIRI|nr:unnamed protein product [Adineta ricciae]CAF1642156.1 unnamed protein product [Adineta ricciae]